MPFTMNKLNLNGQFGIEICALEKTKKEAAWLKLFPVDCHFDLHGNWFRSICKKKRSIKSMLHKNAKTKAIYLQWLI